MATRVLGAVAPWARKFLGSAVSNAAGYGVGGAILPTLEPLTQDLANETWSIHAVKPISATAAAEATLRGFMDGADATGEASMTGYNPDRFGVMQQLAGSPPPLETLFALRRRGEISDGELARGIRQSGVHPEWRGALERLRTVLPSVTDTIRMAVREVFDSGKRAALDLDAEYPPALTAHGTAIGLSEESVRNYWAAHWELPSYTQGTEMLFRGEISRPQFDALLKALDYAPVWRGPLEAIARRIPTITDMIRFAVRDVYVPARRSALGLDAEYPDPFTAQAAKHGMGEQDARDYWAAHWRLPSATQGFRMFHRGEITLDGLQSLLKALDYPPMWRAPMLAISETIPGRIDLKRLLKHEIVGAAEVEAGYRRLGYSAENARHMRAIAEAELEASEAGQPWATRARSRLYTVTHNEYTQGSIDAAMANTLLARVGATPNERTTILGLWDAERGIDRVELTRGDIRKAFTENVYDEARALAELVALGMTDEDAATYLHSA